MEIFTETNYKIKLLELTERLNFVHLHNLCICCFGKGHDGIRCSSNVKCKICAAKHCIYVHVERCRSNIIQSCNNFGRNVSGDISACNSLMNTISLCPSDKPTVHMPLVNVKINNVCNIVALLNTASTNSFVSRDIYERLHLEGDQCNYSFSTLHDTRMMQSNFVNIDLESTDGLQMLRVSNVFVIDMILCDPQKPIDVQHCPHLYGIPVVEMSPFQKLYILIDQHHNAVSHFMSSNNIDVQISRSWSLEDQSVGPTEVGWSTEDRDVITF